MKFTDQQLEQAAKQVTHALGSAPFVEEEQVFSPAFEARIERLLHTQRRKKLLNTLVRSAAAVLMMVIILCGTVLTFDAEARAGVLYHWRSFSLRTGSYSFTNAEVDIPLEEYIVTAEGCTCTINVAEGKYCLQMYESDNHVFFLKYCRMVSSQNFTISTPFWDKDASISKVTINGLEGDLYRTSVATRPNTLVWMDTNSGIAFILFGAMPCNDLIALAESIRPVQ